MIAEFAVPGEPHSKLRPQRRRNPKNPGHITTYNAPSNVRAEQMVAWKFKQAARGHRPDADGRYAVIMEFTVGDRRRRDVDNMEKTVLDGLNKTAWRDDSQVVSTTAVKRYRRGSPGTRITVYRQQPQEEQS